MSSTTYIGLAVASGSTSASATASLANVSTTGSVSFTQIDERRDENASDISVAENDAQPQMEVYPNPGTDVMNIKLHLTKQARVDLQVLDLLGHTVLQLPVQTVPSGDAFQSVEIPGTLSSGVYLVKCAVEGQPPVTLRWVKN